MSTRTPPVAHRIRLEVSRAKLIAIERSLEGVAPIPWATRLALRQLLISIIGQLPPRSDPRVNHQVLSVAALARALVKERGAKPKVAVSAAIQTLAPEKENDASFRDYVDRRRRAMEKSSMPVSPHLLDYAAMKLKSGHI